MVVYDGIGAEDARVARYLEPPADVHIFAIHEQAAVQNVTVRASHGVECRAAEERRTPAGREYFLLLVVLAQVIEPNATVEGHPVAREAVSGGVDLPAVAVKA